MFQMIIPVFQTKAILKTCIESVIATVEFQTEIIIINDGCNYNVEQFINSLINNNPLLNIKVINHYESQGCPKSINEAINLVNESSYVVFADSDIIFTGNWQKNVIDILENKTIGGVGGILIYPQTSGIQCCGIAYSNKLARHIYLNNKIDNLILSESFDVQATVFAFFATKGDIIKKTGYIDESYFNGYEDIDYQFRIREKGYRIVTNKNIVLYHFEKSNGVHRQFSRKQNLGIFWSKNSQFINDDLEQFIKMQLPKKDSNFVLINLCEAKLDAQIVINLLKNYYQIEKTMDYSNYCSVTEKIQLTEILSSESFSYPLSFIFLCDNFVELNENYYWFSLRNNVQNNDLIIDLYANVIEPKQLLYWPGNKIR